MAGLVTLAGVPVAVLVTLLAGPGPLVTPIAPPEVRAGAGGTASTPTRAAPSRSRVPDLEARLAALVPREPMAYFLLAEEVAGEAEDSAGRLLAQQLFTLSYELDRRGVKTGGGRRAGTLGASVCLALKELASGDGERRWLAALARATDERRPAGAVETPLAAGGRDDLALDLATAIGLSRAGEGRRTERLLAVPGVSEMLDRYDGLLDPYGHGGGAVVVRRAVEQWPVCPQCKNRRVVGEGGAGKTLTLCDTCGGRPGPHLTDEQLLYQLRLESVLLSGVQRSWAAQAAVDGGAPLRDLDPSELAAVYGVHPRRPLWRDGVWVADPNAPPEPDPQAASPAPVDAGAATAGKPVPPAAPVAGQPSSR